MPDAVSRRRFLVSAGAVLGVGPLVAACGGGPPTEASACAGYDALSEQDLSTRNALQYQDRTPTPTERCDNCRLYNAPAGDGACGGCQLFAGPVVAGGWCSGWAAMQSA